MNSKWTWTAWDGMTVLSSVDNDGEYVIYIRGTGNSINYKWVLTGSDISCIGNIENLLDYASAGNRHGNCGQPHRMEGWRDGLSELLLHEGRHPESLDRREQ